MLNTKKYFEQKGGMKLLKQYWRAGVLFHAVAQFLLLGGSKTALELLRLIITMKTQDRLKHKYGSVLKKFCYDETLECVRVKKVWIFWWQGMENAPTLVQRCYQSVIDNLSDWEVLLITKDNYLQYVDLPEYIISKLEKGQITITHFSDILRLELLIHYGGLWLDATVLCTSGSIPQSILNANLFVYQPQKPESNGRAISMSSWCIYARSNNKILMATREMLYEYWKNNTQMVDYFLLHHFFSIVCRFFPEDAKKIPPYCNSVPHILLLHIFEPYDECYWNDLKQMTCFHKLSYKFDKREKDLTDTYFKRLICEE